MPTTLFRFQAGGPGGGFSEEKDIGLYNVLERTAVTVVTVVTGSGA